MEGPDDQQHECDPGSLGDHDAVEIESVQLLLQKVGDGDSQRDRRPDRGPCAREIEVKAAKRRRALGWISTRETATEPHVNGPDWKSDHDRGSETSQLGPARLGDS